MRDSDRFWVIVLIAGIVCLVCHVWVTSACAVDIQHKKNTAYQLAIPMVDEDTPADFLTGLSPTVTAYYCDADNCDNGAWSSLAITDTSSEIGTTGIYHLELSASELDHDQVILKITATGAADSFVMFTMYTNDIDTTLTVNLAADAITASVYDESTAYPLKSADAGSTEVARVGADADTLETLSDQLDTIATYTDGIEAKTDNLPASPAAVGSEMNLANDAITAGKFDEATAFPLGAVDSGSTEVARVGADGDTLETLSDEIALVAGAVWDEALSSHVLNDTFGKTFQAMNDYVGQIRDDVANLDGFDPTTDGMKLGDVAHGGAAATLTLASVTVNNGSGSAVSLTSSGGNGHGLLCTGFGLGSGIRGVGGSVGDGIRGAGGVNAGHGLYGISFGAGTSGGRFRAYDNSAPGLSCEGNGAWPGIQAKGGATGAGISLVGGATSGDATAFSVTSGDLLDADVTQEIVDAMFVESVDGKTFTSMLEALTAVLLGETTVDEVANTVAFRKVGGGATKVTITYGTTDGSRTDSAWDDD